MSRSAAGVSSSAALLKKSEGAAECAEFSCIFSPFVLYWLRYHVPVCWNGRRGGLKIRWGNTRVGSSPTTGTTVAANCAGSRRFFMLENSQ